MEEGTKIKLHEAIEKILIESKNPLTPLEIANKINTLSIYNRKVGRPVPSSQISARAVSYHSMFRVDDGRIYLNS